MACSTVGSQVTTPRGSAAPRTSSQSPSSRARGLTSRDDARRGVEQMMTDKINGEMVCQEPFLLPSCSSPISRSMSSDLMQRSVQKDKEYQVDDRYITMRLWHWIRRWLCRSTRAWHKRNSAIECELRM